MKRTYTYCNMNQPQKQRWEFKAQREENIGQTILKTNFQQAMPLLEGSKVQGKIKRQVVENKKARAEHAKFPEANRKERKNTP